MKFLIKYVGHMLKILYAASNNGNAKIQLKRFLSAVKDEPYLIKIAAYKQSSPLNQSIDWTLDCLLNVFKPDHLSLDNDNFITYFDQVKYFAPDLIISDMEYFTSYIAKTLNIKLWQCSSSLINYAIEHNQKYKLGLFKNYSYLTHRNPLHTQRTINTIDNSDYNFVYSHMGDIPNAPNLKDGFKWIRPYHKIGKISTPCQHNVIAALSQNNKNILHLLKKQSDCVAFTEFAEEQYKNIKLKHIKNDDEFFCNLKNSSLFICEGQTSFLADAFYNNKYSLVMTNFKDVECIINSMYSEYYGLSTSIYNANEDIKQFKNREIKSSYNKEIKLLHEKVKEL